MTKKEYYDKMRSLVDDSFQEYRKKLSEYNNLKEERESGKFTMDHLNESILPKMQRLKSELNSIKNRVEVQSQKLTEDIKKELVKEDRLNPKELTEDIKLLQNGLTLTQNDIEGILERSQGNRTMTQLALRYASEHNIKMNEIYIKAQTELSDMDSFKNSVDTLLRWFDTDNLKHYENIYNIIFEDEESREEESGELDG